MKTSIATVSLERQPEREARSDRGREIRCGRDFRERPGHLQRNAGRCPRRRPSSSASTSLRCSRSAISRGCPIACAARVFARAERKFDVMEELGCDLLMICSNVAADSLGGIDRAAADLHELGERASKRGMQDCLRGACVGPPHQRLPRCLGSGAPGGPSGGRTGARHLPHPRAQDRSERHPRDPARSDFPGADGRRATAADGLPLLEPTFPQFSRSGRSAAPRLHGGARRNGL